MVNASSSAEVLLLFRLLSRNVFPRVESFEIKDDKAIESSLFSAFTSNCFSFIVSRGYFDVVDYGSDPRGCNKIKTWILKIL